MNFKMWVLIFFAVPALLGFTSQKPADTGNSQPQVNQKVRKSTQTVEIGVIRGKTFSTLDELLQGVLKKHHAYIKSLKKDKSGRYQLDAIACSSTIKSVSGFYTDLSDSKQVSEIFLRQASKLSDHSWEFWLEFRSELPAVKICTK
ncbi:MAG: hypothetical protein PHW04_07795 [Candidatus Wallbacteria bacterium]|nr:hypothetical protein [Candidatus Wallbacteria bacterium]